ncbi:MAG: undecaprenyl-phosphate galactose phosphotransferase WbaP [Fuerstia sp.]|nr:undecaprenyl-phosphate galactose phosphotransferase WbaP [Fuerstiella sp.]
MGNEIGRTNDFLKYLGFLKERSLVSSSQLIQPLISTDAMSTLTNIVPGVSVVDGVETSERLPSRADSVSRYRQVVLTSLPLVAADLLAIVASYLVATLMTYGLFGFHYYSGLWNNLLALGLCYLIVGTFLGLFPASGMNPVRELRSQVTSICVSFLLLIGLNGLVGEVTSNEILTIIMAFPMTVAVAPPARFCTRRIASNFSWWGETVVIIGVSEQGRSIYQFLAHLPQRGLKPLGFVDDNPSAYWKLEKDLQLEFLGTTDELISICRARECHWAIAAVAGMDEEEVSHILARGSLIPNLIVVNSKLSMPTIWVESFDAAGLAGVHIRDRMLFPFQRILKRLSDCLLATLLLVMSSPLLLFIALWIKATAPGPVFYRHHGRIGRSGRTFGAWKIRTMVINADEILKEYLASNPAAQEEWSRDLKLKDDPRIIPGIGRFLRRTSLDELPQLLNVVKGDMSLVGPRPIYTAQEVEKFKELYPMYLRVRPGLTGLWQVSGRNNTSYEDRVRLDSYYVRNWSLWLDYFILLRTIRTLLLREGAY